MIKIRHNTVFRAILLLIFMRAAAASAIEKPAIMQGEIFKPGADVTEYWISEKLDGVRARWDGKKLISRNGNTFHAPPWFTKDFPNEVLDGELWSARGKYQQIISIVSRQEPHPGWKAIKLMVFDLPESPHPFSERIGEMRRLAESERSPYLEFINQFQVKNEEELTRTLNQITGHGGEGLILHHKDSLYHQGRTRNLLKLKPYNDAEAVVIGYRPGQGQFLGKMGAIKVRADDGKEFYIGSGFSHRDRDSPPPLGSRVTFRYQGYTDNGIPRFAVFIRIREEP